jgi:hypothetical protein
MWRTIKDNIAEISLIVVLSAIVGASGNWTVITVWTILFLVYGSVRFRHSH